MSTNSLLIQLGKELNKLDDLLDTIIRNYNNETETINTIFRELLLIDETTEDLNFLQYLKQIIR